MTNQLNITSQNTTLNWNKFWLFSKIMLGILIVITLVSSITVVPSAFYVYNMAVCLLFVVVFLLVKFRKKHSPFVKIEDNQLQYFCPTKKELIVIPVNEITNITTRFCELQIHTINRTHCLNLNHLKQEKERWEIKEMMKNLAVHHSSRVVNF